jgi:hypothetical protein
MEAYDHDEATSFGACSADALRVVRMCVLSKMQVEMQSIEMRVFLQEGRLRLFVQPM